MTNETEIQILQELKNLNQKVDGLEIKFDKKFDGLNQKVDGLDQRVGGLNQKFDGLDQRVGGLNQKVDGLNQKFDGLDQRVSNLEDSTKKIIDILLDQSKDIEEIKTELKDKVSREEFLKAHDEVMQIINRHDDELVSINQRLKRHDLDLASLMH